MGERDPVVDLSFPLQGSVMPADHGTGLYAAISRRLPSFHGDETVGIHPVRGQLVGGRQIALTRASRLVLRLPVGRIPAAIQLAGRRLDLDGAQCLVGVPTVQALRPAASLASRLVVVRGFTEPDAFLEAVRRQLAELEVAGVASLARRRTTQAVEGRGPGGDSAYVRRTIRIHDKEIVGFAVQVDELTAAESIRVQEAGLGGRRRFGCGIFVPARGPSSGGPR